MGSIRGATQVLRENISSNVSHMSGSCQDWMLILCHRYDALEVVTINKYAFLFTWKGSDLSLKPLVFMAHTDVSPPSFKDEHC